jgi:error-prone DNA polymerase
MPEQPPPKHAPPRKVVAPSMSPSLPYAELYCRTNFSFLEGASHPHELVERAAELSYAALAVTDRSSLAGVVRAHVAAKEAGLKLIIGALVEPASSFSMIWFGTAMDCWPAFS